MRPPIASFALGINGGVAVVDSQACKNINLIAARIFPDSRNYPFHIRTVVVLQNRTITVSIKFVLETEAFQRASFLVESHHFKHVHYPVLALEGKRAPGCKVVRR